MAESDNLPAVIPELIKVRAIVHPQGDGKALVEFPDNKELLIMTDYRVMRDAVQDGLNSYFLRLGRDGGVFSVLWEVAAQAVADAAPNRSFRAETCKTCDFFLRTLGSTHHRKDICRYWVPTGTAQNQFGYLTNVDETMPACGCYRRNPGAIMVWNPLNNDPDTIFVEEKPAQEPEQALAMAWDPIKGEHVEVKL